MASCRTSVTKTCWAHGRCESIQMNGALCVPKGADIQQTTEDVRQVEESSAPGYRTCVKESVMTEFWRKLKGWRRGNANTLASPPGVGHPFTNTNENIL